MTITRLIAPLAVVALVTAGTAAAGEDSSLRSAIEAQGVKWEDAYNAGDAAGVAALYTEDAIVLPPTMNSVAGASAIADFWGQAMAGGLTAVDIVTEEVYGAGDNATELGYVIILDDAGNAVGTSKYMVLWKNIDGAWKLHRDIWNENPPATPATTE